MVPKLSNRETGRINVNSDWVNSCSSADQQGDLDRLIGMMIDNSVEAPFLFEIYDRTLPLHRFQTMFSNAPTKARKAIAGRIPQFTRAFVFTTNDETVRLFGLLEAVQKDFDEKDRESQIEIFGDLLIEDHKGISMLSAGQLVGLDPKIATKKIDTAITSMIAKPLDQRASLSKFAGLGDRVKNVPQSTNKSNTISYRPGLHCYKLRALAQADPEGWIQIALANNAIAECSNYSQELSFCLMQFIDATGDQEKAAGIIRKTVNRFRKLEGFEDVSAGLENALEGKFLFPDGFSEIWNVEQLCGNTTAAEETSATNIRRGVANDAATYSYEED